MHDFDLPGLIRVNQLIRGRIDFDAFQSWYAALPPARRRALTGLLCEFAHQAGVSDFIWEEALAASGIPAGPVVQRIWSARRGEHPTFRLHDVVDAASDEDLPTVFKLFVYLFGVAEGRVYRGESKKCATTGGTATCWTSGW
jgi:hypothetical protein